MFPLEMGADVKAISASGFTVMSLEPAKSWGQMSGTFSLILCSENIRELVSALSVSPPAKRPKKYHSWENIIFLEEQRQKACLRSWERRQFSGAWGGRSGSGRKILTSAHPGTAECKPQTPEAGEEQAGSVGSPTCPASLGFFFSPWVPAHL